MKLNQILNITEKKVDPSPVWKRNMNDQDESFRPDILDDAVHRAKQTSEFKQLLTVAKENSTDKQLNNGSISFDVEGKNGYYVTASGFVRYYGPNERFSQLTGKYNEKTSKYSGQGRLKTLEPIKYIKTDTLDDEDVINKLVERYVMLFKTLYKVIKK